MVIDYYAETGSVTSFRFLGGATYDITGTFSISGGSGAAVFEGGAVLKFETAGQINPWSKPAFLTAPYSPLVCTAKDDDSVGEKIAGSTGNPGANLYGGGGMLRFSGANSCVTNARFCYAKTAVAFLVALGGDQFVVDSQFVNCSNGVTTGGGNITVKNTLFAHVWAPFFHLGAKLVAKNITVEDAQYLSTIGNPNSGLFGLTFTNCIFSRVTNIMGYPYDAPAPYTYTPTADYNGFYNCPAPTFGADISVTGDYPFQSVGAGNYYLAGDTFRYSGTVAIDPALLADLARKTTYPPTIVANQTFTFPTAWTISAVPRDNSLQQVALGYHYDPLDYLCSEITIGGSPLTLSAGVAVALFGAVGFYPLDGGVISSGSPCAMNELVWYPAVQEQPIKLNNIATPRQRDV